MSALRRVLRVVAGWAGKERTGVGATGEAVARRYDAGGRLVEERVYDAPGGRVRELRRFDGRERHVASTFHEPDGRTIEKRYGPVGEIVREEHRDAAGVLARRLEYAYDGNDAIVREFDAAGSLVAETREPRRAV